MIQGKALFRRIIIMTQDATDCQMSWLKQLNAPLSSLQTNTATPSRYIVS
jgi:hypothetical protein